FVAYLAAVLVAAVRAGLGPGRGGAVLVAPAVLTAVTLVLLSPSRSGLVLILLVLAAALSALHLDLRGVVVVISAISVVVLASSLAVGPLVDRASPLAEALLTAVLYALLQAGSAAMVWSQRRVEQALRDLSVAHVELRGTSALLAESSQAQERLRISRE